ncbi:RNA-binding S4 [Luminiphilus syltensis NOR5-1B]|uniref:Heat shock protein 15 n=1 Tax=Luminiphilus syltensis NOR5-1B TaxID=565045 RepID=B8KWC1_9GAMM|nr:S4 domain-containing protein [Luminiphilus syltensis]EED36452.1 RNA-binding S4 [Luminiphilus syltensis NOR5-1B]
MDKLRLDKWLWAARFFKTRSLAKTAIEAGKVHIDGQRVKVSKEIDVGTELDVRQGWDERTVVVKKLSDQRQGAPMAQTLYEETEDSVARRLRAMEARRAAGALARPTHKPDKHQRRQLDKLRKQFEES